MPATDVGDHGTRGKLGLDAVESRDPGAGQVVDVARSEEPLAAAQDMLVMGTPGEPVAGSEPLRDRVSGVHGSDGDLESADYAGRARLIGKWRGVFVGQREQSVAVALTVIGHVSACRLSAQPLSDVSLDRARARRQLCRGD